MPITNDRSQRLLKTRQVMVRLDPREHAEFQAAADEEDRPLAAWLRHQGRLAITTTEDEDRS
jgi:hypothetical protein